MVHGDPPQEASTAIDTAGRIRLQTNFGPTANRRPACSCDLHFPAGQSGNPLQEPKYTHVGSARMR
jgi:hypothetical protein